MVSPSKEGTRYTNLTGNGGRWEYRRMMEGLNLSKIYLINCKYICTPPKTTIKKFTAVIPLG
jgi:hypothetical protein